MKKTTGNHYRQRLIKVIDYIYQNLNGDLNVNRLAEVAVMSPYHFHRVYRELAQETVNATVRRLRLQHAASQLINSDLPLKSAFTKQFSEMPSEYRENRKNQTKTLEPFIAMLPNQTTEHETMYDIEMKEIDSIQLVGYEHYGDYMQIGQVFETLFIDAGTQGLITDQTRSIGLYYDDPKSVKLNELRSTACISVDKAIDLKGATESQQITIPAGKCASLLFILC